MAKGRITRVTVRRGSAREARFAAGTVDLLEKHGRSVLAKANAALGESEDATPGFRMSSSKGKTRHRVTVIAVSIHARRHDRKHATLLKALSSE